MKTSLKFYTIAFMLVFVVSIQAQSTSKNTFYEGWPAKWYTYVGPDELVEYTFYNDKIVYTAVKKEIDAAYPPRIDTLIIDKHLDNNHIVIHRNGSEGYGVLQLQLLDQETKLALTSLTEAPTVEEAINLFSEKNIPIWKELEAKHFYNKEKLQQIQKLPGLDKITRKDLITSLKWRKELTPKIEAYLKDTEGKRTYRIRRFVENYRNQKLITLGYNPYAAVPYNFHKQFAEDKEVLELLQQMSSF